jgi:hypothetical protein
MPSQCKGALIVGAWGRDTKHLVRFLCCILSLALASCVDFQPPDVRFVSPTEGEAVWFKARYQIEAADKNLDRVDFYLDGAKVRKYEASHIVDSVDVSLASHTLRAEAYDREGNHSSTEVNTVPGDYSPPSVRFVSPTAGEAVLFKVEFEIEATAESLRRVDFYVDGVKTRTYLDAHIADSVEVSLAPHTLRAEAYDRYGQYSYAEVSVAIPAWRCATSSAQWSRRSGHTAVVLDGRIWLMGDVCISGDVWCSQDGVSWTEVTGSPSWLARRWHSSLAHGGRIWLFGGDAGSSKNDVWYSVDGASWTEATDSAGWSPRYSHTSVVFGDSMWVLGGAEGLRSYDNDVWCSANGTAWTRATADAGWSPRCEHAAVVFGGKMWVLGGLGEDGTPRNDVWSSPDGVTWTLATPSAAWQPRYGHTAVVYDNRIWVLGGDDGGDYRGDVWYSCDGVSWHLATGSAGWYGDGRTGQASVVFGDKVWLLGGIIPEGSYCNDVWCWP